MKYSLCGALYQNNIFLNNTNLKLIFKRVRISCHHITKPIVIDYNFKSFEMVKFILITNYVEG